MHRILAENHAVRATRTRAQTPALLKGLIKCGHCGGAMGVTFTRKSGKTYRYYQCVVAQKSGEDECPVRSVPAGTVEEAVFEQLCAVFRSPEIVARTYREARRLEDSEIERLRKDVDGGTDETSDQLRAIESAPLTEREVIESLQRIDPVWDELFPGEQARVVKLLVERVTVREDRLEVRLRANGLHSLLAELGGEESGVSGR